MPFFPLGMTIVQRVRQQIVGTRYRREVATSSLTSIAVYAVALVTGPLLARALGPEGRGEIAAVISAAFVLALLLPFGLPQAAAYFMDEQPPGRLLSTATAFGLTVGTFICGGLWFVAPLYLHDYSDTALFWARLILIALPLSVGMQTVLEIQRRRGADASWNRWRSAPQVVPALAIVPLWFVGALTLNTALAAYAIGSLMPLPLLIKGFRHPGPRAPSLATFRVMLPYAWRSAGTWTATSLTARLDQVVLAVAVPSGRLGLYAVAVTAASITNPITAGVSLALFGHLRTDPSGDEAMRRFRRSVKVTLSLSIVVAVLIGLSAPVLLRLAFGEEFDGAATPLRLLLPGTVAIGILGVLGTKLSAEGRPGELTRASIVGAGFTVVGLLLVVPRFGIEGAAGVTSLAYLLQTGYLIRRGAGAAHHRKPVVEGMTG